MDHLKRFAIGTSQQLRISMKMFNDVQARRDFQNGLPTVVNETNAAKPNLDLKR